MCVPTLLRGVLRAASSLLVAAALGVALTACETSLSARIPGSPEIGALGPVSNETGLAQNGPGASGPGAGPDQDPWGEPPAGTGLEPLPLPETNAPEGLPPETLPPETLPPDLGLAPLDEPARERPGSADSEAGPQGTGPQGTGSRAVGPRPPTPPTPPPPFWDPSRDRKVHVGRDGRPAEGPAAQPAAPEGPAEQPDLPPSVAEEPRLPPVATEEPAPPTPALPGPGAGSADDWGTPPGGASGDPLPVAPPAGLPPADVPDVAPPHSPEIRRPSTQDPSPQAPAEDPWLPGGGTSGAGTTGGGGETPTPVDDPWLPGGGTSQPGATPASAPGSAPIELPPTAPTPRAEDPWLPGTGGSAKTDPAPADGPRDPWTRNPSSRNPSNQGRDDPLAARGGSRGESATGGRYVGATAGARAMEQVTRLTDQPGSANVLGYPDDILRSCDAGMALTSGRRPAVVVFYDDTSRASDLQAARLLPLLVRYGENIDFVSIDRGADAQRSAGAEALAKKYLDHVPTVVLLDAGRQTRFYRSGLFEADELERALDQVLDAPAAVVVREPSDPLPAAPGRGPSDPTEPFSPSEGPPAGPVGGETPPTGPLDRPLPGETPAVERPGMAFTPPAGYSAKAHAQRLRSAPGDAAVPGYPTEILVSAPPERVLAASVKPAVIIFYDDSSKASDLQAAAFLPLLVQRQRDVELVLIDVGTRSQWSAAQKKVVRTYYNFYVPTTVVLAPNRAPIKSWYSRTEAADLARAIDQATGRSR